MTASIVYRVTKRTIHSTSRPQASVLFALQALSNSRETQHLNKISKLNRVEHSPTLQLIKSSEVDPFPSAAAAAAAAAEADRQAASASTAAFPKSKPTESIDVSIAPSDVPPAVHLSPHDTKALHIGRTILADNARIMRQYEQDLAESRATQAQSEARWAEERQGLVAERDRLTGEVRSAGALIVFLVAVATGAVAWRGGYIGNGSQKLAKTANKDAATQTLPAAEALAPQGRELLGGVTDISSVSAPVAAITVATAVEPQAGPSSGRWWRNLLWKRD